MKDSSPLYGYVDVYQWRGCHWIDEFLHLYSLRRFKIPVYWEFKPWDRKSRLVFDSPSSFHKWKTSLFFVSGDGWETIPSESSNDALKLLRSWGTPMPDDVLHVCDIDAFFLFFVDSICSHLKKWYHNCLEKVKGYVDNVFDFDELISPQSLFVHFLGPKPSNHVQKNMETVRKSKCIDFVNIRRPLDDFSLLIIPPPPNFFFRNGDQIQQRKIGWSPSKKGKDRVEGGSLIEEAL